MFDYILLSRLQFAVTTVVHIVWPVLSIGLSLFLVVFEALWLRTGEEVYYRHARFWGRLFLLNFGVGVVTGIPLEFQFGTNWAPFSVMSGDFFGNILGFEAAMAFLLGGISAWYLLKNHHRDFYLKSFRLLAAAAIVVAPLQILLGDLTGDVVARYQPAKLAAMEANWQTNPPGKGAPWVLLAWP